MDIQSLLDRVNSIKQHYEKIAELTGENFNIFKILKVDTREVRLHSAFIAELLNPKGTHGQGNAFVKEFLEILKKTNNSVDKKVEVCFDTDTPTTTEVEKWLGYKTVSEGGYIDILLVDTRNKHIIIENKIYACDQENQLIRYHNFDKEAPIVYLTLNGDMPGEFSTSQNEELLDKLICISYKEDILKWLENCKKYSVDHPLLRETLTQYINVVKYLTNKTINNNMSSEIVRILKDRKENVLSAFEIARSLDDLKAELMKMLINQMENVARDFNLKIKIKEPLGSECTGFYFYKEEWKYYEIGFEFDSKFAYNFFYGFCCKEGVVIPPIEKLDVNIMPTMGNDTPTESWHWWLYFPRRNWSDEEFSDIPNNVMQEEIKKTVREIVELIEDKKIIM